MQKIIQTSVLVSALLISGGGGEKKEETKGFTPEQTAEASLKANAFFDRVFDAKIDRDPMQQSLFGIKKDYGKWQDISEENAMKEQEITKAALDSLHTIDINALDEQTKISYRLFEKACKESIENFKWHLYDYAITQMGGLHADIPTFLINVH